MKKTKTEVIRKLADQIENSEKIIFQLQTDDVLNVIEDTLSDEEIQSLTAEKLDEIISHINNHSFWKEAIQRGIRVALEIIKQKEAIKKKKEVIDSIKNYIGSYYVENQTNYTFRAKEKETGEEMIIQLELMEFEEANYVWVLWRGYAVGGLDNLADFEILSEIKSA